MTLIFALPKGRISEELVPLLNQLGIEPEPSFFEKDDRALEFGTNHPNIRLVRVRSFDVPTFVAHGAAQMGVAGSDVLSEFNYNELYAPLDLGIGKCRLSLAAKKDEPMEALERMSHVQIATKYPNITSRLFATRGIQAECIKLSGAMELAPKLGLAPYIVDLVSTGSTLKANGLEEREVLMQVSSKLIINRTAFKTRSSELHPLLSQFTEAVGAKA